MAGTSVYLFPLLLMSEKISNSINVELLSCEDNKNINYNNASVIFILFRALEDNYWSIIWPNNNLGWTPLI